MLKLTSVLLFFFLTTSTAILAQQEVNYALFRYHLNLINPAAAGTQGAAYLNLGVRNQWQGVADAPQSFSLTYNAPQKNERVGLGINVNNDKTFVEQQTQAFVDFSYRLPLGDEKAVYLGIKGGGTAFRLNASGLPVFQTNLPDPNLINVSSFVPNIGVGGIYHSPQFYFGFSIPRMLSTARFREKNGQETRPSDRPHYYVNTGLRLPLSERFEFTPAAMLSMVHAAPSMLVLDASFSYNNTIDFGAQYTQRGGIGGTFNLNLNNAFQMSYAYITQSGKQMNFYAQPTHELLLRIRVGAPKILDVMEEEKEQEKIALHQKNERIEQTIGTRNKNFKSGLRY